MSRANINILFYLHGFKRIHSLKKPQ
jgi:hypothetical protein